MKVAELIKELEKMPPDARVWHLWDGEPRTAISVVYLSRSGRVITAAHNEVAYSTNARPADAPKRKDEPYWKTPKGERDYIPEDEFPYEPEYDK